MNVVALVDFHDNLKGVDRKRGEEFVVSRERFDEINEAGYKSWFAGAFVEEVKREKLVQSGKQTPESRSKAAAKRRSGKAV